MISTTRSTARAWGPLSYPEGPCRTRAGDLLCVEYGRHALVRLEPEGPRTLWEEPGAGPASVAEAPDGTLWVCAYEGRALLHLGSLGRVLARYERDASGDVLEGPNDLVVGAAGEVYFTVSGEFEPEAPARGKVLRLLPGQARPEVFARGIHYANGIALGPEGLFVAEHFRDRILHLPCDGSAWSVRADLSALPAAGRSDERYRGPDGIALGPAGELYAAHFGCGRLVRADREGALTTLELEHAHPTNVALLPTGELLVTAFAADAPPHEGAAFVVSF